MSRTPLFSYLDENKIDEIQNDELSTVLSCMLLEQFEKSLKEDERNIVSEHVSVCYV